MTIGNHSPDLTEEGFESPQGILDGLAYLRQCLAQKCGFGIIVGSTRQHRRKLIDAFADGIGDRQVVRLSQATDNIRDFLQDLLLRLGLEPDESCAPDFDDLLKLLTFFLRHEARQGHAVVIIVEELQAFGPRALDAIQILSRIRENGEKTAHICLAGTEAVHRILDSEGMSGIAALTRNRFELDADDAPIPDAGIAGHPEIEPVAQIAVSLDGKILSRIPIDQDRMLIGRSKHSDVPIMSRFVSRYHALLVNLPNGTCLVDLKSANGTTVNSVQIRHCMLKHGDTISIGNYRLHYESIVQHGDREIEPSDEDGFSETVIMRSMAGIGLLSGS